MGDAWVSIEDFWEVYLDRQFVGKGASMRFPYNFDHGSPDFFVTRIQSFLG